MVRTLLLAALLASGAVSADSLRAQLDKPVAALGEPVSLTLVATGLSLDTLDITPLTRQFDVFARTLSRGTDNETLVLTLYPRAVGSLRVPSLQIESSRTAALNVTILDGSETVPQVSAHWALEPAAPRVNQPARLRLSICDDDSLQWNRLPIPTASGRLVRALGEEMGVGTRGEVRCTLHHYDWSLIATQSGNFALEVPMLDATRFGLRLRYPGPAFSYQVQSLPAWLPAHVPPVKPQIVQASLPQTWPLNRPLSWRFQITGGYSAEGLKALLDLQLRESAELGFYPPLITRSALDDIASPLTRFEVTVYAQPRQRGTLQLPGLRLPWYDTERGQMMGIELKADSLKIVDPHRTLFGQIARGVAGVLLLAGGLWQLRRMLRWRRARRRGLQRIAASQSVERLGRAVREFSLLEKPPASSLGEWVQQLHQEVREVDVADAVAQLEQQQFGLAKRSLGELQQAFLVALKRVRPKSLK